MLTKEFIRLEITKKFRTILKEYGYDYNSKHGFFIRNVDKGFCGVVVGIVEGANKFTLSFSLLIRFDEVEEIANQFQFVLPEYRAYTHSMNISSEFFTGQREYIVRESLHLDRFIDFFKKIYESKIDEFLIQNSTIGDLDKSLHEDCLQIGYLQSTNDFIHRLIICKLSGNKRFDAFQRIYSSEFKKQFSLEPGDEEQEIFESAIRLLNAKY
jgi:hypothetical protein